MGAARNKLVLGLSLYGQIYKLKYTEEGDGFHKQSEGVGAKGPFSMMERGVWGYMEISFFSCDGISRRETE